MIQKSSGVVKYIIALEAVRIWEGGDYVDRLRVKDGVITEEEVEL